jgi:ABC-type antimicrobial peptide transport system permease subunit
MSVGAGLLLAVIGVAAGLVMAYGLSTVMVTSAATILFRVSNTDPPTYTATPIILTAVVLLACYIAARRALKVDPIIALRGE